MKRVYAQVCTTVEHYSNQRKFVDDLEKANKATVLYDGPSPFCAFQKDADDNPIVTEKSVEDASIPGGGSVKLPHVFVWTT